MNGELSTIVRRAVGVWIALVVLALATLGFAYLPAGAWNLPVALAIAAAKALLVAALFMELVGASTIARLAAFAGVFLVAILFALTFADEMTRPRL